MSQDIALLQRLGMSLDAKISPVRSTAAGFSERQTIRDLLIASVLRVRNKKRGLVRLAPNRAQREFANACTHR
ncbi:MAG TPA: hypothetical protein VGL82_00735, partial [Bryobacteraceae bacterium]